MIEITASSSEPHPATARPRVKQASQGKALVMQIPGVQSCALLEIEQNGPRAVG
ncbi:hypothetical protein [Sorangium sp. So ce887]|uniref:hypothetical protein n=1 Tax=Sorangium sp. So ce887 TaxID=3133324 RepID=UPI003F62A82E